MYLLLGSAGGGTGARGYELCGDPGDREQDRVSASSGIASGSGTSSSQPWLEDQDLSGSSCEGCNTNTDNSNSSRKSEARRVRRQRNNNNSGGGGAVTVRAECHGDLGPVSTPRDTCHVSRDHGPSPVSASSRESASPGLNSAYRAMVSLAGNRTPSIEQSVCLTETTDCPSDISVITSLSAPRDKSRDTSDKLRDTCYNPVTGHVETLESRLCHPDVIQGHRRHVSDPDSDLITRVTSRDTRGQVTLPPTHLRALVRDRLRAEGISLSAHPYTQVTE